MIKKFLNGMCWMWFTFYGIIYTCIVLTEGVGYTIENVHCDGVGSFITGVACVVLVTTHFVLPFIHRLEDRIQLRLAQHRHAKEFKKYANLTIG